MLAEELLPAPDHLCAVLEPKSGSSEPVKFTAAQPVLFQLRFPQEQAGGVLLKDSSW